MSQELTKLLLMIPIVFLLVMAGISGGWDAGDGWLAAAIMVMFIYTIML